MVGVIGHGADNLHLVGLQLHVVPLILQPCLLAHQVAEGVFVAINAALALTTGEGPCVCGGQQILGLRGGNEAIGKQLWGEVKVILRRGFHHTVQGHVAVSVVGGEGGCVTFGWIARILTYASCAISMGHSRAQQCYASSSYHS